ncbi:hypothetical protein D3C75_1327940 [compost metagenome]
MNAIWGELQPAIKKALGQQFIDMARASAEEFDRQAAERDSGDAYDDLKMSSGGFNPLERQQQEPIPAPVREPIPAGSDDPFAED